MNSADKITLKEFTKSLSTLHYALLGGAVLVALLIYFFEIKEGHINYTNTDDIFLFICPFIAIAGVSGGNFLFKQKLEKIRGLESLDEKLQEYRGASISKFALVEGPTLICIVAAMNTKNLLYLFIAILLMVYFFSLRVTEERVVEELELI